MSQPPPNIASLSDRAADAVTRALAAGAESAEAIARSAQASSVAVRLGALEDVGRSEDADLIVRVFIGTRSASVSTADPTSDAIDPLVERAVAMARFAPASPWAGLAPAELLFRDPPQDLDLVDPLPDPSPDELRDMAQAAEDAARAVAGVTNSEGGSAAWSRAIEAHVTSPGFAGTTMSTGYTVSASVLAGEGQRMQRAYDWHSARHRSDLRSPAQIGRTAGDLAVARLDPSPLRSGRMPVLFDPRVAASLIGHLIGAMAGPAVARKRSFLANHEAARLFPQAISLVEDPHLDRGLKSRAFDGEGLPTRQRRLVDGGIIGPWLCDLASARQLGCAPSGHGSGGGGIATGNLALVPGSVSRAELMADVREGVLVTELIGQGVDMLTGDYSRGASGWRIVDGEIAGPVAGFTIAGNLLAVFADLQAANDLDTSRATHVPTLRTDSLTIAGG